MANIALQRIQKEIKEVLTADEVKNSKPLVVGPISILINTFLGYNDWNSY